MGHLEGIGLSRAEADTYEALVLLGATTTGDLIKESGVASSHIYEVLQSLIDKGLVTYYLSRNIKHFEAADPSKIYSIYEDKKKRVLRQEHDVKQEVNRLVALAATNPEDTQLKVYEGIRGIRTSIQKMVDTLKEGDTYYVLGAPLISNKRLNAFYRDIHAQRIEKGIKFRIIYNESAQEFAQQRAELALTDIRIIDADTPTELCVFGNYAQIIIFSKTPILLEIHSPEIAKSFRTYFEASWETASEL